MGRDEQRVRPTAGSAVGGAVDGACSLDDLAGVAPEELAGRLRASRRAENVEVFRQLRVAAALWVAWLPDEESLRADREARRRHVSGELLHEAFVVTEAAAALGLTEGAAGRRVDAALALLVDRRLPATAALAAGGGLDWRRLDMLVLKTRYLSDGQVRAVEERVLVPAVVRLTYGLFEREVDRAVLAVDPAAAEERRAERKRSRRVSFFKDRDGSDGLSGGATLFASGPAEALLAAFTAVDAAARWLRKNGDDRTLDQLRHDLLVHACVQGFLPVPQDVLPDLAVCPDWAAAQAARAAAGGGETDVPDDGRGGGDGVAGLVDAAGLSSSPRRRPGGEVVAYAMAPRPVITKQILVTVTEETLAGRNEEPADLAGYGPITAQMARDLAQDGIWRCAAVDDQHATITGVGRKTWTPGYVPGKALRDFLAVAAVSCSVPWCNTAAVHCDIDHRRPHAAGGATCSCNTDPLCRRHHREKSAGHLTTEPSTDPTHPLGTTIWRTRAGQVFVALPYSPLPPDAYRGLIPATPPTASTDEPREPSPMRPECVPADVPAPPF